MEKNMNDLLRRVRIRTASQLGLEDESIPYSNGPVNNDEALAELLQISRTLTEISVRLARLEGICKVIEARQSSPKNVQTVHPPVWGQKHARARQLLMDLLTKNPEGVEVKRIRVEAAIMGISMRTMYEAKRGMGLKAEKRGTSWWWKWPDHRESVTIEGERGWM